MPWRGPEYPGEFPSLGWGILQFIEDYLVIPDGDRQGEPFVATREQAAFTVHLFRIQPSRGKRIYRDSGLFRPKGWGKSPFAAALGWAASKGPSIFDGWDANGNPVGRPPATPWLQVAAVAEDQTANTWSSLYAMATHPDAPLLYEFTDIDPGITRINMAGGGLMEYVTSRAGTREGQRVTFAILDETQHWYPHNGGTRLAATIRRNVAKMNGLTIETTNMFSPGEQSVAEATYEAAPKTKGILLDAREAPAVPDLSKRRDLRAALKKAYGDSVGFISLDRLVAECNDPRTAPNEARRFYLNQRVSGVDTWMNPDEWDKTTRTVDTLDGLVTVGFSGARYTDAAAVVGCHVETGHLFTIAMWEQNGRDDWEVPIDDLDATIDKAFDKYDVARMYANPVHGLWDSYIDEWAARHGAKTVVRWAITREAPWAHALANFRSAIRSGDRISHERNETSTRHVLNAHQRPTRRAKDDHGQPLHLIERPHPDRSITWTQAAVLAYEARGDAVAAGTKKKPAYRARGF